MTDKYNELVKLQKETMGAAFTVGYSTRSGKHQVLFYILKKRFESPNPEQALDLAIKFVLDERFESLNDLKYTLIQQ